MNGTAYPWYWSWRGWRASTWLFLLWSALVCPQIVTLLRSDGWLDRDIAAVLIIFWLLGVHFIGMARAFASLDRVPRAEATGRSVGAALRAALPFASLVLLVAIAIGPHLD